MRAVVGCVSRKRRSENVLLKKVYAALPTCRRAAVTSKTVSQNISERHASVSGMIVQLEKDGHITKFTQKDTVFRTVGSAKKQKFEVSNTYYFIGKGDIAMSLNLEGLRKECAKAVYESMRVQAGEKGMLPWHQVNAEHKRGFEKLAGTVFDVLFKKHPEDLIKFFTDGRAD